MTERRENIARALSAADEWNNPDGLTFKASSPVAQKHYRRLADAAIAADDGAAGRVLALADELERTADSRRVLALDAEAVGASEECLFLRDRADDERAQADAIRAAVGAPATAEDGERG